MKTNCSPSALLLALIAVVVVLGYHYKDLVLKAIFLTAGTAGALAVLAGLVMFVVTMVRAKRTRTMLEARADAPGPDAMTVSFDDVPADDLSDLNQPGLGVTQDGKITVAKE